jgi:hypothetical protein
MSNATNADINYGFSNKIQVLISKFSVKIYTDSMSFEYIYGALT